jgi:hypothetical protein
MPTLERIGKTELGYDLASGMDDDDMMVPFRPI